MLRNLLVAREALHLEERALVPVQAEPAQAVEDRVHRLVGRALEVGVLDAQHERAAVPARVGPVEYSAVRAPPMCRKPVGLGAKRVRTFNWAR